MIDPQLGRDLAWFLRACADAVERGDLDAHDVRQALFDGDGYTIGCPISEVAGTGRPHDHERGAAIDALDEMATRLCRQPAAQPFSFVVDANPLEPVGQVQSGAPREVKPR